MGLIPASQARRLFKQETVAFFSDRRPVQGFFRSFFRQEEIGSRYISIEVEREGETVAVDVVRGTGGNRNTWDRKTQKVYDPAAYDEYFDATELDCYEDLFGVDDNGMVDSKKFGVFLEAVNNKTIGLMAKIDRAYEIQAMQAIVNGIVIFKNGDNIDYKRKAASNAAYNAAWNWALTTVDPNDEIKKGCDFINDTGKITSNVFDVVMAGDVYQAYINNTFVKARALQVQWGMDAIEKPMKDAEGKIYHGMIAVDNYNLRIWTANGSYKDPVTLAQTRYMPAKKIVIMPELKNNTLTYGLVPQLASTGAPIKKGKFFTYEYPDLRNATHEMGIKSCGLAVPIAIDQTYTATVLP